MKPEITRCPVCKRKRTRSNPANARLWLLYHMMADRITPNGQAYTPEVWHEWAKSRFLGMTDVMLPNGKTLHKSRSSAELDTTEFAAFMEQVEQFAAERGVYLDAVETLS